jgi:hypothetical protein
MKRIWQVSTSLMLTALLAHQASAEGYGPRSWKSYLPGSQRPTIATAPLNAEAAEQPTPAVKPADVEPAAAVEETDATETEQQSSRKTAKNETTRTAATATKVGEAATDTPKVEKFASYYAQNEAPPPAPGLLQDGPPTSPSDQATPFRDEGAMSPLPSSTAVGCSNGAGCNCGSCNNCDPMTSGCDDVCNQCMPTRNFAKIEYLMWWGKGRSTPPLVTSSFAGTPAADAGELGLGTTTILYGGNDIGTDWRSGGRLTIGRVLDQDGTWMAVGRFYGLDDSEDSFHAESALGDPILARPFFNVILAQQDALLVAFPGVSQNGVIDIQSKSDMLGAEALVRHMLLGEEDLTIDFVAGYQFNRLDDSLNITNSELILVDPLGVFAPGTTVAMRDTFRTRNEFHGAAVGLAADVFRGPFRLELLGKLGFGNQRQTVTIDGNTEITPAVGPVVNDPQGLLARATNSGTFSRDVFTIIPEANLNLGYQVNNWTFSIGYSFMYWKDVAWAGDQIDTRVNLSNPLVGAPLPAFQFRNTDHWLQGINFGAEYAF